MVEDNHLLCGLEEHHLMMIKAAYFPTIIYAKDVNLDNRLFEKTVIDWSNQDKGVQRTNMKGWHSQTNMHEKPVFKP